MLVSSSLSPSEMDYLCGALPTWRELCPKDEVLREEEEPPLESRRFLKSRLRELRFEEGCPRQSLSEPWVERSPGQLGVDITLEYAVRRAKRRVHAALLVDGINEVDCLDDISLKVRVGKFSIWASRECPAEETPFASAARKVHWRCMARTFVGTVMKAKSHWRVSQRKKKGSQGCDGEVAMGCSESL